MGLMPDPSYLILHQGFEHKESTNANFKVLCQLLEILGRSDMEFVNSLVVIITPVVDVNSDMAIVDQVELRMSVTDRVYTRIYSQKTSGTTWFVSDGDSPTNPYWTFYPVCGQDLQSDGILISTALTSWLITETMRCLFMIDVYSVPQSKTPVLKP